MISWCLNIILLLLSVATIIEYKAQGDKCYNEGKQFAAFSALVPDEEILAIWCKGGSLYISQCNRLVKVVEDEKYILVEQCYL